MRAYLAPIVLLLFQSGCVGSAGGDLFEFSAFAAGPTEANGSFEFESGTEFHVSLTRAKLHIGAVYMNKTVQTSVSSDTSCTLAGIYVAEVTTGLDVDVLSGTPQPFPLPGFTTSDHAKTGEVWLIGEDPFGESDPTVILDVVGTATKGAETYPFEGAITMGKNQIISPPPPQTPGKSPVCKLRIATPIPLDIVPRDGGSLLVRVDPRGWFGNVDFSKLEKKSGVYRFKNSAEDQPSANLAHGLVASIGSYVFTWEDTQP